MYDHLEEMMYQKVLDEELELSLDTFVDYLWVTEQLPYNMAEHIFENVTARIE